MTSCTIKDIIDIMYSLDSIQLKPSQEILSTSTLTQLGIDSLDKMNIFILLEEKFNISIPDEDFANLNSLEQIKDYINQNHQNP